jgi:hypothetical protein
MTDTYAELDAALEAVVAAARAHLAAVRAADGAPDDDEVWRAYVALNNAAREYDEQLNDAFGEVTPWDLEEIPADEADGFGGLIAADPDTDLSVSDDPHAAVLSVRQRRDYRVPSVGALIRAAEAARRGLPQAPGEPPVPVTTVAGAVLELLQSGDGSLGMLDLPELEPLDGLVVVAEVSKPLDPEQHDEHDGEAPFRLEPEDRTLARLDERPFADLDDDGEVTAPGD